MPSPRTEAAHREHLRRAAYRAVEDPAKLARAVRVVQAGLAERRISLAELVASAPALTAEQVERLRALLAPGVAAVQRRIVDGVTPDREAAA